MNNATSPLSDKEVGQNLVKGTLMFGAAGATAGSVIGILRQQSVPGYAFAGGLNASLFGMTFIAFRESLLRFQRSKNPEYGLKDSQTMDIDQLWSSTLAGAGSGGILSALSRGPKSAPSGTFMFGALAFAGQWISSRASRYRQDQILAQSSFDDLSIPASSNSTSSSPSASQSQPALNTLLNVLPMHRTDLDEYEVKLRHKLERIEAEQQFLTQESLRRERLAVEKADQEKTV